MAFNITDILALFRGDYDAVDCPHCAAKGSITPSLVGLVQTEDVLLVLDRGFDPVPAAYCQLAQLKDLHEGNARACADERSR